jgi:pyridoxamine 5'-phosphate oxidase
VIVAGEQGLSEGEVDPDPLVEFGRLYRLAEESGVMQPDAMALATATADGVPSARMVLLKGVDERGFVFFTNYESRKAVELAENPRAALILYWVSLRRQVRVTGRVDPITQEESEAYFRSRPFGSRLAAWASRQSSVIPDRSVLEDEYRRLEAEYGDEDVPLPPFWGGYRLTPDAVEFWMGRENRLHDRLRYRRDADASGWIIERLSP